MASASALELARIAKGLKTRACKRAGKQGRTTAPFDLAYFTDAKVEDNAASIANLPKEDGLTTAVIFRHYDAADRPALAKEWRSIAAEHGHLFLMANDVALAKQVAADGIHLPEHALARISRARTAFPNGIISTACHSLAALSAAEKTSADCAFLSPIFPTSSHPDQPTLGPSILEDTDTTHLPVLALGGINLHTASKLENTNFQGIGAIDGLAVS
jgi:thiamine-phosphate pyrophosphorylase